MSSKTFKSVVHGSSVQVHDNGEGVFIGLLREDSMTRGTTLSKSDAPALALAILEAAGYREERKRGWDVLNSADENIAQAMRYLSKGIEIQKRTTAEAKEQAELEAEALELFNQYRIATQLEPSGSWDEARPLAKKQWLAVARRAREMSNEKKVNTDG